MYYLRLQNIVSRYNDVDPEEHRLLKVKLAEDTLAFQQAIEALKKRESELDGRVAELSEQLANAKSTIAVNLLIYFLITLKVFFKSFFCISSFMKLIIRM